SLVCVLRTLQPQEMAEGRTSGMPLMGSGCRAATGRKVVDQKVLHRFPANGKVAQLFQPMPEVLNRLHIKLNRKGRMSPMVKKLDELKNLLGNGIRPNPLTNPWTSKMFFQHGCSPFRELRNWTTAFLC